MNQKRLKQLFRFWKNIKKNKLKYLKNIIKNKQKKENAFLSVLITQWRITTRNVKLEHKIQSKH